MKTKQCTECNVTFSFTSKNNPPKYCDECRLIVHNTKRRLRAKKKRELNAKIDEVSIHPKYLSRHYKVTHEN